MSDVAIPESTVDWESECRGLGYMIVVIENRYQMTRDRMPVPLGNPPKRKWWWSDRRFELECMAVRYDWLSEREARTLGGDNELLFDAVKQAHAYVDGPLREKLGPRGG